MRKARREIHSLGRTQYQPSQSTENPESWGYYWQVLARACKGFNVQRQDISHVLCVIQLGKTTCCRQREVWRSLDATLAPSHMMFIPKLRSFDMKFCAHELCAEGTLCHYTVESSPQSYHLH